MDIETIKAIGQYIVAPICACVTILGIAWALTR